jgi:hypothetical protein
MMMIAATIDPIYFRRTLDVLSPRDCGEHGVRLKGGLAVDIHDLIALRLLVLAQNHQVTGKGKCMILPYWIMSWKIFGNSGVAASLVC